MFSQTNPPFTEKLGGIPDNVIFIHNGGGQFSTTYTVEINQNQDQPTSGNPNNQSSDNQDNQDFVFLKLAKSTKEVYKFFEDIDRNKVFRLDSKDSITRIFREVVSLTNMVHPLICGINKWNLFIPNFKAIKKPIYEMSKNGGHYVDKAPNFFQPFISMPYYDQTLETYLNSNIPSTTQVILIVYGLLRGYRHIHSFGFLMRDIQPRNIMLREVEFQGQKYKVPVIIDFGGCKFDNNQEEQSIQTGAILYLPKNYRYREYAKQQHKFFDFYACGVTIEQVMYRKQKKSIWNSNDEFLKSKTEDPFYTLIRDLTTQTDDNKYDFNLACLELEKIVNKHKFKQIENSKKWYERADFDKDAFDKFKKEIDAYEKKHYGSRDANEDRQQIRLSVFDESNIYRIEGILKTKASEGNQEACIRIANDYQYGHILPKDLVKCIKILFISYKRNHDSISSLILKNMCEISQTTTSLGYFYKASFSEAKIMLDNHTWESQMDIDYDSTISDYRKAYELEKSPTVLSRITVLMHKQSQIENSNEQTKNRLETCIKGLVSKGDVHAMAYYGKFLIDHGKVKDGIAIFQSLLQQKYIDAASEIARGYEKLNNKKEAMVFYQIAYEQFGDETAKYNYKNICSELVQSTE